MCAKLCLSKISGTIQDTRYLKYVPKSSAHCLHKLSSQLYPEKVVFLVKNGPKVKRPTKMLKKHKFGPWNNIFQQSLLQHSCSLYLELFLSCSVPCTLCCPCHALFPVWLYLELLFSCSVPCTLSCSCHALFPVPWAVPTCHALFPLPCPALLMQACVGLCFLSCGRESCSRHVWSCVFCHVCRNHVAGKCGPVFSVMCAVIM